MTVFDHGSLCFWLSILFSLVLVYLTSLAVYRFCFHPLSKYPGPFLAKITDAYMLYYAWRGDRHVELWRLHEKYGKIVRFGPCSLSFNSAKALKDIYGPRSNLRKAAFYKAFMHPAANTHNTRNKIMHGRKRRVLRQAFSDRALREMEQYMLANIRIFCGAIGGGADAPDRDGWSLPKNMDSWCDYLAIDILGDLCFGKTFQMLEREDDRWVLELTSIAARRDMICGTMPLIEQLGLDKILFRQANICCEKYNTYSRKQLTERTKLGEEADRKDFFHYLLTAKDPETGKGFNTTELWGEANLLIIAGSDTTSTAMAATLFYLVRNPQKNQRATAEVVERFESAGIEAIAPGATLSSCVYLRACIDEAMRLAPPVGGLLPRETETTKATGMTCRIDSEDIPGGVVVGTPLYALHRNKAHFSAPHSYVPERWIVGAKGDAGHGPTTKAEVEAAQNAFSPFSIGPRGCIAKNMAYAEMMTTLARVLFLYDIRDANKTSRSGLSAQRTADHYLLQDAFTSIKDGPLLEFRKKGEWGKASPDSIIH